MLDNLRRTLSAPAAWLTLVAGWTFPHAPAARVDRRSSSPPSPCPPSCPRCRPRSSRAAGHLQARPTCARVGRSFALAAAQIALGVTFLAHQAWLMADAIGRTLVRLYLTRRRLLEWVTAAQAKSDSSLELRRRVPADARRAGPGRRGRRAGRAGRGRTAGAIAAPFLVLLGPLARSSPDGSAGRRALVADAAAVAGGRADSSARPRAARWRFFETFVRPADNVLPPDNFQEDPSPVVAHRTSPTNIGLYLLSTVAARDFGWLGTLDMRRAARGHARDDGPARALPGPLLQLVRHAATSARSSPATCPPWTAGTSPAICSFSATPVASAIERPLLDPGGLRRHRGRARARRARPRAPSRDDRRTQTVTLGHLDESREALADDASRPASTARPPGPSASVSSPARPTPSWTSRAR